MTTTLTMQMAELPDKDFKAAVIEIQKFFNNQLQIALKQIQENHNKEVEVVKKNQMEILELKDPIHEILPGLTQ